VSVDGREVATDSVTLEDPLKPGYVLGAQVHLADYATGATGEE
jgi:hypothetical protein